MPSAAITEIGMDSVLQAHCYNCENQWFGDRLDFEASGQALMRSIQIECPVESKLAALLL